MKSSPVVVVAPDAFVRSFQKAFAVTIAQTVRHKSVTILPEHKKIFLQALKSLDKRVLRTIVAEEKAVLQFFLRFHKHAYRGPGRRSYFASMTKAQVPPRTSFSRTSPTRHWVYKALQAEKKKAEAESVALRTQWVDFLVALPHH